MSRFATLGRPLTAVGARVAGWRRRLARRYCGHSLDDLAELERRIALAEKRMRKGQARAERYERATRYDPKRPGRTP